MGGDIVLVGCGNMGHAMLAGWLRSGAVQPASVAVVEPNESLRSRAAALGVRTVPAASDLPADARPGLVVFAVKPQVMASIVPDYRRFAETATFLSVAAGTPIASIEEWLGDVPVIRCMPNTPASIGKGMMVTVDNGRVSDEVRSLVTKLLSASGKVTSVPDESLMDAVTALSGSGPAYLFHFIEALDAAGRKAGLPAETAKLLALQTIYGAACLAAESGEEPGRLREQVTSPNGTTAAALAVLMGEDRLTVLLSEAVEAARLRSIELGK